MSLQTRVIGIAVVVAQSWGQKYKKILIPSICGKLVYNTVYNYMLSGREQLVPRPNLLYVSKYLVDQ